MNRPVGVCWDVDGTLLRAGRVGGAVMRRAFRAVTGHDAPLVPMSGMTDHLVAEALRDGLPPAQAAELVRQGEGYTRAMVAAIAREWDGRGPELAEALQVLPGIPDALARLAQRPGVDQLVVTGNVRAGAELKLTVAGLCPGPLDLETGVYGDRPGPRSVLVHAARSTLERRHGGPVALVVVGDTPRDVEAAHAADAVAVGVATGASTVDELRAAGADHVAEDLSDPTGLVAIVAAASEDHGVTRGSV